MMAVDGVHPSQHVVEQPRGYRCTQTREDGVVQWVLELRVPLEQALESLRLWTEKIERTGSLRMGQREQRPVAGIQKRRRIAGYAVRRQSHDAVENGSRR